MDETGNVNEKDKDSGMDLESLCEFLIRVIDIANSGRPGVAVRMLESFVEELQWKLELGPKVDKLNDLPATDAVTTDDADTQQAAKMQFANTIKETNHEC